MDDLEKKSRTELMAQAVELKIAGRNSKNRAWLIEKIREAAPPEDVPDTERPAPVPTEEEQGKIERASEAQLRGLLNQRPAIPGHLAEAVRREMVAREEATKAAVAEAPEPVRYEVTKGGKFVIGGRVTHIATGSIIYPKLHDVDEVRKQGIELREFQAKVTLVQDPMWGAKQVIG